MNYSGVFESGGWVLRQGSEATWRGLVCASAERAGSGVARSASQ